MGNRKTAPQCKAKAKHSGNRCLQPARPGYDVCRYHGAGTIKRGTKPGAPIVHGHDSIRFRKLMEQVDADRLAELTKDPGLLDVYRTIAASQTFMELYMPASLSDDFLRELLIHRNSILIENYEPTDAEIVTLRTHLMEKNLNMLARHADVQIKARKALTQEQVIARMVVPLLADLGRQFMSIVAEHVDPKTLERIRQGIEDRQNRVVYEVHQRIEASST